MPLMPPASFRASLHLLLRSKLMPKPDEISKQQQQQQQQVKVYVSVVLDFSQIETVSWQGCLSRSLVSAKNMFRSCRWEEIQAIFTWPADLRSELLWPPLDLLTNNELGATGQPTTGQPTWYLHMSVWDSPWRAGWSPW